MYYSWTGKICIFITVINFPNNNRHTTVFHEKAYFSTIMKYFLQDIIAPRMSSHCYKKYAALLPPKWLKTAYFCIETLYNCHKVGGEDVTSLLHLFYPNASIFIPTFANKNCSNTCICVSGLS